MPMDRTCFDTDHLTYKVNVPHLEAMRSDGILTESAITELVRVVGRGAYELVEFIDMTTADVLLGER